MTASTPDLTKLETEMRARALAATPGVWRMCGHARGGCFCGEVWALACDAPVATAQIGEWEGGSISESAGRANAAHIAASCPSNVIAVLDGKDAEIARERVRADKAEQDLARLTVNAGARLNEAEANLATERERAGKLAAALERAIALDFEFDDDVRTSVLRVVAEYRAAREAERDGGSDV